LNIPALLDVLTGLAAVLLALFGCAGIGDPLLGPVLAPGGARNRLGLAAAIGISVFLALCGIMELFSVASPAAGGAFLAVGCLLWVRRHAVPALRRRAPFAAGPGSPLAALSAAQPPVSPAAWAVLLAAALACLLLVANSAHWHFGNRDDAQGYLVLYTRIVELGAMGADPFLYRRFEAGLGGGTYLYLLHAWPMGIEGIRVMDIGLGLFLLAALMAPGLWEAQEADRRRGWPAAIGATALLLAVAFAPGVNMTPEIIAMGMFLALLRLAVRLAEGTGGWRRAPLLGLLVFALACVKTTFLIPAAAVVGVTYLVLLLRERSARNLVEPIAAALFCLALMAPWMLVSFRAVGTAFFPVLGIGKLSPAEVAGFASPSDFLKSSVRIGLIMALPLWMGLRSLRRGLPAPALAAALLPFACTAVFILLQAKYTVAGYRYGYAGACAVFLFYLTAWLREPGGRAERRVVAPLLLAVGLNVSVYFIVAPGYAADTFHGGFLYRALVGVPPDQTEEALRDRREALRRMQAAVPAGAPLLVRVDLPYVLDFRRNTILAMDWPGLIGPGQGPPAIDSPTNWRAYLRASGVRFLAYSYGDRAGTAASGMEQQLARSESLWQRTLLSRTLGVQAVLAVLQETEAILHDDGVRCVIDLGPPG